jgi:iron complex transport system permease protein
MNAGRSRMRNRAWFGLGIGALAGSMAISLMLGAFSISPREIIDWITRSVSGTTGEMTDRVLSSIRLPRVLGAASMGAALGSVGAVLQGTYRTPLADAHLLGYSSAAGVGAALGFALTPVGTVPFVPVVLASLTAAAFGIGSAALRARTGADRFILAGVAFGFALLAWTGVFVLIVDSPRVPTLLFFVFGTLSGTTWKTLVMTVAVLVPALVILWRYGPGLDLMALGDREATHLGFNTAHLVPVIVGVVGVAVGASVVLGGVVGFVGLLVPFALRPLIGPRHRTLIPGSAIAGAIAVVVIDTLARTLASPAEIPLGLLTAAVGGPFLAWMLLRRSAT